MYNIETILNTRSVPRTRDEIDLDSPMVAYGVKVSMTADEHDKLVQKFGAEDTDRLVDILDGYLLNNPRKRYASHYRAILSWCVRELTEQKTAEQRLKNAQEAGQRTTAQRAPATGFGVALADANRRIKEIEERNR